MLSRVCPRRDNASAVNVVPDDVARGIKSFKKGLSEDEPVAGDPKVIDSSGQSAAERDKTKTS